MLSFKKIKKTKKVPFPLLVVDNFLSNKLCDEFAKEIINFNKFDDKVMVNRNRINKGSENFQKFVLKSNNINKFYKNLNNLNFYKKLQKLLTQKFNNSNWKLNNKITSFSKKNYGLQSGKKRTKNIDKIRKKNILNLDIDFSSAEAGYFRSAHRDRDTRVINFVLYLNTINKKDGGAFEIFDTKKEKKKAMDFQRFPNKKDVRSTHSLIPKKGQFIVFKSTPDSYHGVTRFKSNKKKRIFLYGSFSLNKTVNWKQKID